MVLTFTVWGDQGSDMSWLDVRVAVWAACACCRSLLTPAVSPPPLPLQAPPCDVSVNCNPSPTAALIVSDLVIATH